MTVLVIGGTGTVGANLVERLARSGEEEIRVLTRDSERARGQLPKEVELAEGNLLDPYATRRHFFGVDRLFLSVAAGPAETQEGLTAIELARRADVTKVVYMSTHHVERTPAMPVGGGTKLPIENAIKASGMGYTILRPNSFLQNDRWYFADHARPGSLLPTHRIGRHVTN
ncbi:SDR family oxidoreductase [Streptomyces sp. NPDC000880]